MAKPILYCISVLACFYGVAAHAAEPRIIGGEPAVIADHPWMVALVKADKSPEEGHFCGASLIAPEWVLTAGHCVVGEVADEINVLLGTDDLAQTDAAEQIGVRAIYLHPGYFPDLETGIIADDIALLRLARPSVQTPITAAPASLVLSVGTAVTTSGWGNRSVDGFEFSNKLESTNVAVTDPAACELVYGDPGLAAKYVCAAAPGRDSCQGDSGGPLTARIEDQPVLVGVVSFGNDCADQEFPGAYSRVSNYERYLIDTMQQTVATGTGLILGLNVLERTNTAVATYENLSDQLDVQISNVALTDAPGVTISADSCSVAPVAPGADCTVEISWTPDASGSLRGRLNIDAFDGSVTLPLATPVIGLALEADETLSQPLDAVEQVFHVDGSIDWDEISDSTAVGGAAIGTDQLSEIPGFTVIATVFEQAGTLRFNYRGANTEMAVIIDEEEELFAPGDAWVTGEISVPAGALVGWPVRGFDSPASVQLDAIQFVASGDASVPQNDAGTGGADTGGASVPANDAAEQEDDDDDDLFGIGAAGSVFWLLMTGAVVFRSRRWV